MEDITRKILQIQRYSTATETQTLHESSTNGNGSKIAKSQKSKPKEPWLKMANPFQNWFSADVEKIHIASKSNSKYEYALDVEVNKMALNWKDHGGPLRSVMAEVTLEPLQLMLNGKPAKLDFMQNFFERIKVVASDLETKKAGLKKMKSRRPEK